MKLSLVEKHLFINQYEILKSVDPQQKEHYELMLSALQNGYDADFEELLPQLSTPLSDAVRNEVHEILAMFRALAPTHGQPAAARFVGFDGNEESEHCAYATFLLEDRGRWKESHREGNDYNTHHATLSAYRAMLKEWRASHEKDHLTPDDVQRIIAHAPFGSVTK